MFTLGPEVLLTLQVDFELSIKSWFAGAKGWVGRVGG